MGGVGVSGSCGHNLSGVNCVGRSPGRRFCSQTPAQCSWEWDFRKVPAPGTVLLCLKAWSRAWSSGASLLQLLLDEPVFDLLACPRRLAQKREAGLYRRIESKRADRNPPPEFAPAMPLDELIDDVLQRDAVQWIARMGRRGWHKSKQLGETSSPRRQTARRRLNA